MGSLEGNRIFTAKKAKPGTWRILSANVALGFFVAPSEQNANLGCYLVDILPQKKPPGTWVFFFLGRNRFWVFLRPWGKIHFEFRHGTRFATEENDGALWIFPRRNRLFFLAPSEENARLNCGAARISLKKIPETIASVSAKPYLAAFFSAVWKKCPPELQHGSHFATKKAAEHLFFFFWRRRRLWVSS